LSLVATSVILIVLGNLPVVAEQIYPGALSDIPNAELLREQQVQAVSCLALDLVAFVAFYAALLIFGQMSRRKAPMANRLVTLSLAALALSAGFMALSPVVSMVLIVAAIISVVPIPMMLAIIAERRVTAERRVVAGSGSAEPTTDHPVGVAEAQMVAATE
jgi:MFS family permease